MDNSDLLISSIPYHVGINADKWEIWRNSGEIGFVQLAFKIIVEAMYDLILGEVEDHISASYFFFGTPGTIDKDCEADSLYWLWAEILGIESDRLPVLVEKYKTGHVTQKDMNDIRNLFTVIKTI